MIIIHEEKTNKKAFNRVFLERSRKSEEILKRFFQEFPIEYIFQNRS